MPIEARLPLFAGNALHIGASLCPACQNGPLRQLEIGSRELLGAETFHPEGDAYYATLGITQPEASDNSNTNDKVLNGRSDGLVSGKLCPPLPAAFFYMTERSVPALRLVDHVCWY